MKVSVNQDELDAIQEKAEDAGLSRSRFVREVALGYKVKARDLTMTPELIKLNAHLGRVGNNLNQVARQANKAGVCQEWVKEAQRAVMEMGQLIDKVSDLILDR